MLADDAKRSPIKPAAVLAVVASALIFLSAVVTATDLAPAFSIVPMASETLLSERAEASALLLIAVKLFDVRASP